MIELLEHYSLPNIVSFVVFLSVAVKSCICFYDWAIDRWKVFFNKETAKEREKKIFEEKIAQNEEQLQILSNNQDYMREQLDAFNKNIALLIESDKNSIKSYITEKHHTYIELGEIDDYTLDCLEKRYDTYVLENGNSFIKSLMDDIRHLPIKKL